MDCLRQFALECDPPLSNPDVVTSTKLRKYIATISQVLSLNWLARHLGHDVRVHREFYRIHESTIEIAKVSKLLLAVDGGKISKWAGKCLDEIDIDGKYFKAFITFEFVLLFLIYAMYVRNILVRW